MMGILSLMTYLPLLGVLGIALSGSDSRARLDENVKILSLFISLLVLALAVYVGLHFDFSGDKAATFQFVEHFSWFPSLGLTYQMGVDGISLVFVLLSALLVPLCILASWNSIKHRVREYMAAFLILETFMIGMFCALDLVLFYIFFEGVLIPMFLIIGIWGGYRRIYATFKLFLYTFLGSIIMLVGLIVLYKATGSSSIPDLMKGAPALLSPSLQGWLWWGFFAAFAVKIPMVPFHTWLPDAHVEAPTAGSVILAGVLLKMGGYGFLRFSLPMLPQATLEYAHVVYALSLVAVIYTSLIAFVQTDIKKVIAYSSVAHMGYVTAGLFALTVPAVQGAIFQMLSHGLVSAALFLCIGVLYDRLKTRDMDQFGGVTQVMPRFAVVFMLFILAGVGLPGTSGFVGEFLVLIGTYSVHPWVALGLATGLVLGAVYSLWLYRRVMQGPIQRDAVKALSDLSRREQLIFAPLIVLVLWMGIFPTPVLSVLEPGVKQLLSTYASNASLAAPDFSLPHHALDAPEPTLPHQDEHNERGPQ
jgi:NADH-quinone oxidoreductase subunit M